MITASLPHLQSVFLHDLLFHDGFWQGAALDRHPLSAAVDSLLFQRSFHPLYFLKPGCKFFHYVWSQQNQSPYDKACRHKLHILGEFDCHNILYRPAIIHIPCSKLGVAERMIAEIVFIIGCKTFLSADIVSAYFIECKRIAEILHISANGLMIDFIFISGQRIRNTSCRWEIWNVIHHIFWYPIHEGNIPDFIFLSDIPGDQRIVDICYIIILRFLLAIEIGTWHSAFNNVSVKRI